MSNYMLDQIINDYKTTKSIVEQNPQLDSNPYDFTNVKVMFEDKISNPDLKVMIYGVYNAGKSTLINAMAGKEVAEVGDVPVTSSVAEYACGSYKVIDTPGIDAPAEHEEVTIQEMRKADAIIFVVNPIGVVEEQKTLNAMLKLMAESKKVFLVFNEKHPLSVEDYLALKDQTYKKIQELAPKFGLANVLSEIPISKVNAKVALTARKSGSEGFLKSTGYVDFELELNEFLSSITDSEINDRLVKQLLSYLNHVIKGLEENTNDSIVRNYDQLIKDIKGNRSNLRREVRSRVENKKEDLYKQIKTWLYNQRSDIKPSIQQEIEQYCQLLGVELKDDLDVQGSIIQSEVTELQAKLPELNVNHQIDDEIIDKSLNASQTENIGSEDLNTDEGSFDLDKINIAAQTLQKSIKVEHIVTGLNAVKAVLPRLMKDMSEDVIEQVAKKTVAKYIPYIGPFINVALSARDIFGTDSETKQLMQQKELQDRAVERWEQQIEDTSTEISKKFASDITSSFYKIIDDFFDSILEELSALQNQFSAMDKNNSILLESLYSIQKDINSKVA